MSKEMPLSTSISLSADNSAVFILLYILLEVSPRDGAERQLHLRSPLWEFYYETCLVRSLYSPGKAAPPVHGFGQLHLRLLTDKAPEMLRLRQRAIQARRGHLDEPVEALLVQRRRDASDHARSKLMVHRTIVPVHEQGQKRPA